MTAESQTKPTGKEYARKPLAESLAHRHSRLKQNRATWDTLWQEIAEHVMPRKAEITSKSSEPSTQREAQLFDNTAIEANQVLANGQLAWMTPHEATWFAFDAPDELRGNDEVAGWFSQCTRITQTALARSNFYSEIHELYLDRGAFGTGLIYVEPGRRVPLLFQSWPAGTFSVSEDDEGLIDTVFREFQMTLRQAIQKFGKENLPAGLAKKCEEERQLETEYTFLHAIYARNEGEYDPRKIDGENMPIASVYLYEPETHVCRVGGYREMPAFTTRYLKWGKAAYGWSPAWYALPESRQLQFVEKNMDALAEVAAFPRILLPDSHEGDVDMRAGGVTYFNSSTQAKPAEWATQGRYDIGQVRAEEKRQRIRDAFHVDLFKMFASLDKQMTAREVAERSSEKLIQFSPTFARMTTELFNPMLQRVFALLLRAGLFPPPPEAVILQNQEGGFIPEPRITFSSRIALAIKSLENIAFGRTMELVSPLIPVRPDVLDNFDLDKIVREGSRNDGLPADWLLPLDLVEKVRQQRAEAAAQQQQMEQASAAADAISKAGRIQPDSMAGQMLQGAAAA